MGLASRTEPWSVALRFHPANRGRARTCGFGPRRMLRFVPWSCGTPDRHDSEPLAFWARPAVPPAPALLETNAIAGAAPFHAPIPEGLVATLRERLRKLS